MLTLICGVSRAGKTTLSQIFDNVIHLDDVAPDIMDRYPKVNSMVSKMDDVTVEGIYDRKEQRIALLEAYKGTGTRCIFLDPSEEEIRSRPWGRRHGYKKRSFEAPSLDEGWETIIWLT